MIATDAEINKIGHDCIITKIDGTQIKCFLLGISSKEDTDEKYDSYDVLDTTGKTYGIFENEIEKIEIDKKIKSVVR